MNTNYCPFRNEKHLILVTRTHAQTHTQLKRQQHIHKWRICLIHSGGGGGSYVSKGHQCPLMEC